MEDWAVREPPLQKTYCFVAQVRFYLTCERHAGYAPLKNGGFIPRHKKTEIRDL